MVITADSVRQLREKTNCGMMDCKFALAEAGGDMDKAVEVLRKKGLATAAKKADRATGQGIVESYIHLGGKIGVLVEVNCETDFVARNIEFHSLVRDMAMQIAATNPAYLNREAVPESVIEHEKDILREQAKTEGKPAAVIEKMVEGRLSKFYQEMCLLDQPFIKDQDKSITDLVKEHIAKFGENIQIRRFTRYQMGENV